MSLNKDFCFSSIFEHDKFERFYSDSSSYYFPRDSNFSDLEISLLLLSCHPVYTTIEQTFLTTPVPSTITQIGYYIHLPRKQLVTTSPLSSPQITSLQPSFCDIDLIVRDRRTIARNARRDLLLRSWTMRHRSRPVSAAKKIISSFCKRPSPPPFLEATSLTTHSSSTVSNNLYRRRLQAVFPAVKKSSGAEGERYTRLRGD